VVRLSESRMGNYQHIDIENSIAKEFMTEIGRMTRAGTNSGCNSKLAHLDQRVFQLQSNSDITIPGQIRCISTDARGIRERFRSAPLRHTERSEVIQEGAPLARPNSLCMSLRREVQQERNHPRMSMSKENDNAEFHRAVLLMQLYELLHRWATGVAQKPWGPKMAVGPAWNSHLKGDRMPLLESVEGIGVQLAPTDAGCCEDQACILSVPGARHVRSFIVVYP